MFRTFPIHLVYHVYDVNLPSQTMRDLSSQLITLLYLKIELNRLWTAESFA